jgi:hypothetical protein
MNKKAVLASRNAALFAAQEALTARGFRGEMFVIESHQEVKRGRNRRFVVLYLTTNNGGKATVAIRLHKEDEWQATSVRILTVEDAPEKLLGLLRVSVDTENGIKLLEAFMDPFPSLDGIDPKDVIRAVTTPKTQIVTDKEEEAKIRQDSVDRIQAAIDEASYGNEWPGKVVVEDTTSWAKSTEITLIPYVGDRFITVHGSGVGWGHGNNWGFISIEVNCLARPSSTAMDLVIKWIHENGERWQAKTFWAGERPERADRSMFEHNRAIAQYFELFAPDSKAPYRAPNQFEDYSLTDWLEHHAHRLGVAERSTDEGQFGREFKIAAQSAPIRELLGLTETDEVSSEMVYAIIAEHHKGDEPVHTETSRAFSAKAAGRS